MAWMIAEGPYDAPWGGRDATGWGWVLANEAGARRIVTVWISGTAMAVAPQFLPEETATARATSGRSEIERLLVDEVLPREVMLDSAGRTIEPGEAGWWVELRGDQGALDVLLRLFAQGETQIVRRGGQAFLRSADFAEMADEQEVRLRAAQLLREAIGAAWVEGEEIGAVEVDTASRVA